MLKTRWGTALVEEWEDGAVKDDARALQECGRFPRYKINSHRWIGNTCTLDKYQVLMYRPQDCNTT
jgi:hypothetical protein